MQPSLNLLFVCVENSNRSQMAEAFARMHGGNRVAVHSAGSRPAGRVNPRAVAAMAELGYNLSQHGSKSLTEIPAVTYDAVVTMACGDNCPHVAAMRREDWPIPALIERNVRRLLYDLLPPSLNSVTG